MSTDAPQVICLGEALVDFLPPGRGAKVREVTQWRPCLGGGPSNIAVGLARLGVRSALLGVTGDDEFGHFLLNGLKREGVDTRHFHQLPGGQTGLAFISLDDKGERSFSFFRRDTAEYRLARRHIDEPFIGSTQVLQLGTNSLVLSEAREAALHAVDVARQAGRVVSCDPNVRLHVWRSPEELKTLLRTLVPRCNVFKMSEEEVALVTGYDDVDSGLRWLVQQGVSVPVITRGAQGASSVWQGHRVDIPALVVDVVDTTGAGDGFMAGLLAGLLRNHFWSTPTIEKLREAMALGCRVGAHAVQHLGATDGLPRNI